MLRDPNFQIVEGVQIRLSLCSKHGTVLKLSARPLQANHQHTSELDCDFPPGTLLNQRQVDPGSDARRGYGSWEARLGLLCCSNQLKPAAAIGSRP